MQDLVKPPSETIRAYGRPGALQCEYSVISSQLTSSCGFAEVGYPWYSGAEAGWNIPMMYTNGYITEKPELNAGRCYLLLDDKVLITWEDA